MYISLGIYGDLRPTHEGTTMRFTSIRYSSNWFDGEVLFYTHELGQYYYAAPSYSSLVLLIAKSALGANHYLTC